MRAKILAAATLVAVAACQPPAADPAAMQAHADSVKAHLGTLNARYAAATVAGNVDSMIVDYASDVVMMAPNMPAARGTDQVKAAYAQLMAPGKPSQFHMMDAAVAVDGDLAVQRLRYHMVIPAGTASMTDSGSVLVHWHKDGTAWKVKEVIWNSDNPPMPMPAAPTRR